MGVNGVTLKCLDGGVMRGLCGQIIELRNICIKRVDQRLKVDN